MHNITVCAIVPRCADPVEHFSVKHTTSGILQGFPGARRWNGDGGCQARLFVPRTDCAEKPRSVHWNVSRKANLAKLGSGWQNKLLWRQRTIDDFIECEGSLAARSRRCGLHVSWWRFRVTNSACVTCRRRFSISMLRTNELRLVLDVPVRVAMVYHGNRVRTGGSLSSPTQTQARRARTLPCCLAGSSRIHSIAQIPRTRVLIQRHRHLNERR